MNGLEFIASVISSLAWPLVVIAAVVLLRKPLAGLIPLMRHVKYKDLEIDFSQEVHQLRDQADRTLTPVGEPAIAALPEEKSMLDLAALSPRAAVIDSWRLVEMAIRRAIEARNYPVRNSRDLMGPKLIQTMGLAQVLNASQRSLIDQMRMLRNQAAHAEDFTIDETAAREYVELATEIIHQVDAAAAR